MAKNGAANPLKKFESLSVPFRRVVAYTSMDDAARPANARRGDEERWRQAAG
jgi:hypothetical protein